MATSFKEIEKLARRLAIDERAKLAEQLLESLQEPPLSEIEAVWAREIEERLTAYDRGELETITAEDVFAEALLLSR